MCSIITPSEDTKIIEFDKYQKPDKVQFVIYADLENLIDKIDGCKSNSENSSPTKLGKHILSCFLTSTILSFISIENKHDVYIGKDCMKKFCESLRKHAIKIINFKKKKIKLLAKEQQESYENAKICYTCKEKFEKIDWMIKKYCKVRDHWHYTGEYSSAAHSKYNLKYSPPKKIIRAFHKRSNYDDHFVIKGLAKEFKKQFTCFQEKALKNT